MKHSRLTLNILLSIGCIFASSLAYAKWSVEVATGIPYNFPMPLLIQQDDELDINLTAHYETRPFQSPFYYNIRIGKWLGNKAWEVETIHHKIYLRNTNDEVSHFSISHGYNMFTLNRAWLDTRNLIWRIGGGVIIAHPESKVRGETFDERGGTLNNAGYYLAGPTAMASVGKRFYLTKSFFLELEGKLTASYAYVKVVDGHADVPLVAIHADFGFGYDI